MAGRIKGQGSVTRAAEMSEVAITRRVFRGESPSHRGLTDAFSLAEIQAIAGNKRAGMWRWAAIWLLDARGAE